MRVHLRIEGSARKLVIVAVARWSRARVRRALAQIIFFFFKQKTAYEMCGRDWSSDVCSSDLTTKFSIPSLPSGKCDD